MQGWLGPRQCEDQSDQHLNQDTRNCVEDIQDMLEVQDTKWMKPGPKDAKKTSQN